MSAFRFVHCADLHIDSPFRGLQAADESVAEHLRHASFAAFDRIVELCLQEQVDFLLVAGDVFDSAERSLRAQFRFRDQLNRLASEGISCFVVHGNHDPLDGWIVDQDWHEGVTIFGGESIQSVPVERDGVQLALVHGVSYPTREVRDNLSRGFRREPEAPFHIGLLHCNVGSHTGHEPYAPCSLQDLVEAGMDYWALGHVHRPQVLRDERPVVCYAGTSQGRSPVETGEHGCYLVDVAEDGAVSLQFVATDSVRWTEVSVSVEDLTQLDAVVEEVERRCREARDAAGGRNVVARVTLIGSTPLSADLHREGAVQDLLQQLREVMKGWEPFLWIDRLQADTRSPIDREAYRGGQTFVGELLRLSESLQTDPDALDALRSLLAPVFENTRAPKALRQYGDDQLRDWLRRAEERCLELLVRETSE